MVDQPFLKWAGGKRWLAQSELFSKLPAYNRYVEPFLGGGAILFALRPPKALVSDINTELVHLYQIVQSEPTKLQAAMAIHSARHSKDYYYKVRAVVPEDDVMRAARTLYLNRTCWNGLYRVNLKGIFNVPIGTKQTVLFDNEDFCALSRALSHVKILCADFEVVLDGCGEGDLVFLDPPYTVAHNMNGFVKYNERMFRWEDQIRLRGAAWNAAKRGAMIVMTNADHPSVSELYSGIGMYSRLDRHSVISGKNGGRRITTEALITMNL